MTDLERLLIEYAVRVRTMRGFQRNANVSRDIIEGLEQEIDRYTKTILEKFGIGVTDVEPSEDYDGC